MRVVILLPWRSDGGWRDKLWDHCKKRWAENFPEWAVYAGWSDDGPFNRAQAVNRAAQIADELRGAGEPEWDVALVIDGDTVSEPAAVRRAVERAQETGRLCIAHDKRVMLNESATKQVLMGTPPERAQRRGTQVVYTDSVSCAVAVARRTWDAAGGFDERFVGWGFEDTAFEVVVETLTGPKHREDSTCYHLWHKPSPEASKEAPTYRANRDLRDRYLRARGHPGRVAAVLRGDPEPEPTRYPAIPRILWRTVPERTPDEVETWWGEFLSMHPGWEYRTVREPVDPAEFPLTGHLFDRCASGAQKAGLIRLELLVTYGGVYVDSDVQPVRPLDVLTHLPAFAAWEDDHCVPDAILGAVPGHPAMQECLRRAVALVEGGSTDAWETGPGVTTAVLPWRDDVLLMPPGSLYPVHYKEKHQLGTRNGLPWVFTEHKWHHSWDPKRAPAATRVGAGTELEKIDAPEDLMICIPWNDSTDPRRKRALDWCVAWWRAHGLKVVIGDGRSRAEMCNDAAGRAIAQGAGVLVFADADTWAPARQVVEAAERARDACQLVHAFDVYSRMDQSSTAQGLLTKPASARPERLAQRGKRTTEHVSGLSAVPVGLWRRVGGFDERFDRWGFEDQAFHLACEVLGDAVPGRVAGPAIHWYHRADPTRLADPRQEHLELITRYCEAAGRVPTYGRTGKLFKSGRIAIATSQADPDGMREVLAEEGGPLSGRAAVQ